MSEDNAATLNITGPNQVTLIDHVSGIDIFSVISVENLQLDMSATEGPRLKLNVCAWDLNFNAKTMYRLCHDGVPIESFKLEDGRTVTSAAFIAARTKSK